MARRSKADRGGRSIAAALALLLLGVPALNVASEARWYLRAWRGLRETHRDAADSETDRLYQRIAADLPPRGFVNVVTAPSMSATDADHALYFLQYSLAPRLVGVHRNVPFVPDVVVVGAPWPGAAVFDPTRFTLVREFSPDLHLVRQLAP